nr:hypothetical protein CFP56_79343 [Quercus suber]
MVVCAGAGQPRAGQAKDALIDETAATKREKMRKKRGGERAAAVAEDPHRRSSRVTSRRTSDIDGRDAVVELAKELEYRSARLW